VTDFVTYPHPALNRAAQARPVDGAMLAAGAKLLAAAEAVQAYGLAAAHLGLDEPVVVMSVAEAGAARAYRLLYNPEITGHAGERAVAMEGSVSLPGIEVPVSRPVWAEIAYDDGEGRRQSERFEGFVARVAQHEIDQVNGVFFLKRISAVKRDIALRKFQKSQRA
jgi:peptide deformylase